MATAHAKKAQGREGQEPLLVGPRRSRVLSILEGYTSSVQYPHPHPDVLFIMVETGRAITLCVLGHWSLSQRVVGSLENKSTIAQSPHGSITLSTHIQTLPCCGIRIPSEHFGVECHSQARTFG